MYKIYINENLLMLADSVDQKHGLVDVFALPYFKKPKSILNLVDRCEKASGVTPILLHHPDLELLWADFCSLFKWEAAAGGLIENQKSEMLFIYRRGFWDLPKGKAEPGETPEETAIREVKEETGLSVDLGPFVGPTYHTFRSRKGKRKLKYTDWYDMTAHDPHELKLQSEEDIEDAVWLPTNAFGGFDLPQPIYSSIADLMERRANRVADQSEPD